MTEKHNQEELQDTWVNEELNEEEKAQADEQPSSFWAKNKVLVISLGILAAVLIAIPFLPKNDTKEAQPDQESTVPATEQATADEEAPSSALSWWKNLSAEAQSGIILGTTAVAAGVGVYKFRSKLANLCRGVYDKLAKNLKKDAVKVERFVAS